MKNKIGLFGTVGLGILALVIRIVEYFITLDQEGYYLAVSAASVWSTVRIAVLIVGLLLSLICYAGQKEQTELSVLYSRDWMPRILFGLMGVASGVDGIFRLMDAASSLDAVTAVLFLTGAFGWLWMGRSPKRAALWTLLPMLQLAGQIVYYFWTTYKYIHISAYLLGMLGWCAALFFTFSLSKTLVGAACSKERLGAAGGIVLVLLPMAFVVPLFGGLNVPAVFTAAEGLILSVLAGYTLNCLSRKPKEAAPMEMPDLSMLNEYMDAIPEVEEE